jgi:hypothetical protein
MTGEVVGLNGKTFSPEEQIKPNENLINVLESYLEDAKSGKLQGFIGVGRWPDSQSYPLILAGAFDGNSPYILLEALNDLKEQVRFQMLYPEEIGE